MLRFSVFVFLTAYAVADQTSCEDRCTRLKQRSLSRIGYDDERLQTLFERQRPLESMRDVCWRLYDNLDCMKKCPKSEKHAVFAKHVRNKCRFVLEEMEPTLKCISKHHSFLQMRCSSFLNEASRLRAESDLSTTPRHDECRFLHLTTICLENHVNTFCPDGKKIFRRLNFRDYFLSFVLPTDDDLFDDEDLDSCQIYDFVKDAEKREREEAERKQEEERRRRIDDDEDYEEELTTIVNDMEEEEGVTQVMPMVTPSESEAFSTLGTSEPVKDEEFTTLIDDLITSAEKDSEDHGILETTTKHLEVTSKDSEVDSEVEVQEHLETTTKDSELVDLDSEGQEHLTTKDSESHGILETTTHSEGTTEQMEHSEHLETTTVDSEGHEDQKKDEVEDRHDLDSLVEKLEPTDAPEASDSDPNYSDVEYSDHHYDEEYLEDNNSTHPTISVVSIESRISASSESNETPKLDDEGDEELVEVTTPDMILNLTPPNPKTSEDSEEDEEIHIETTTKRKVFSEDSMENTPPNFFYSSNRYDTTTRSNYVADNLDMQDSEEPLEIDTSTLFGIESEDVTTEKIPESTTTKKLEGKPRPWLQGGVIVKPILNFDQLDVDQDEEREREHRRLQKANSTSSSPTTSSESDDFLSEDSPSTNETLIVIGLIALVICLIFLILLLLLAYFCSARSDSYNVQKDEGSPPV